MDAFHKAEPTYRILILRCGVRDHLRFIKRCGNIRILFCNKLLYNRVIIRITYCTLKSFTTNWKNNYKKSLKYMSISNAYLVDLFDPHTINCVVCVICQYYTNLIVIVLNFWNQLSNIFPTHWTQCAKLFSIIPNQLTYIASSPPTIFSERIS